jgi:hypothetical protein
LPRPDLRNLDVYLDVASHVVHDALEVQTLADYHGFWLDKLAQRHKHRPMHPDQRLVTEAVVAGWNE